MKIEIRVQLSADKAKFSNKIINNFNEMIQTSEYNLKTILLKDKLIFLCKIEFEFIINDAY